MQKKHKNIINGIFWKCISCLHTMTLRCHFPSIFIYYLLTIFLLSLFLYFLLPFSIFLLPFSAFYFLSAFQHFLLPFTAFRFPSTFLKFFSCHLNIGGCCCEIILPLIKRFCRKYHCVKSVRIRGYSSPYFPVFGLNTERYGVSPNAGKY